MIMMKVIPVLELRFLQKGAAVQGILPITEIVFLKYLEGIVVSCN